jgi:hypothetical protein
MPRDDRHHPTPLRRFCESDRMREVMGPWADERVIEDEQSGHAVRSIRSREKVF